MATGMEGEEGLIEFCDRSQRGVLDLVIELIAFAGILAFLAQGCLVYWVWSESDLDEVAGKIVFGQKSWAAVLASEKFVIMRTWHALTVDLTTTEKKPGCSLLLAKESTDAGDGRRLLYAAVCESWAMSLSRTQSTKQKRMSLISRQRSLTTQKFHWAPIRWCCSIHCGSKRL